MSKILTFLVGVLSTYAALYASIHNSVFLPCLAALFFWIFFFFFLEYKNNRSSWRLPEVLIFVLAFLTFQSIFSLIIHVVIIQWDCSFNLILSSFPILVCTANVILNAVFFTCLFSNREFLDCNFIMKTFFTLFKRWTYSYCSKIIMILLKTNIFIANCSFLSLRTIWTCWELP